MRVPLRTESDAFRVVLGLALAAGAALLVGALASAEYGVVTLAAGLAAGVVFELAGREGRAAEAPPPHPGARRVLVVASARLGGEALERALAVEEGGPAELAVLAPILASRAHYWASDVDRERAEARERLDASLAWAAEQGLLARGEVSDEIEDELRQFAADEVIVVMRAHERRSWLADRMLAQLSRELDVPVREIVVEGEA
jgi:hypothetical protein